MTPENFAFIAKLLKEKSGLVLSEDKVYLLEGRLMPVARKNNFASIEKLIDALKGKNLALSEAVIEAMTTNESFFFRDSKPFEQFREIVLPHLLKARASKRTFRIWCAACSSGQEPYSLAMILKEEQARLQGWNIEIVATDLSKEIVQKAKDGIYSQFEVQRGLPVQMLVKYFEKQDDHWQLSPTIRSMVTYRTWNLLEDFKQLGQFDVVFCRNVLIYFDQPTKTAVLDKVAGQMPSDGFLYLGGAETVLGISNKFKPVPGQRGVYLVNTAPAPQPAARRGPGMPIGFTGKVIGQNEGSGTKTTPTASQQPAVKKPTGVVRPPMAKRPPGAIPSTLKRPDGGGAVPSAFKRPTQPAAQKTPQQSSFTKRPAAPQQTTQNRPAQPASPTTARPQTSQATSPGVAQPQYKRPAYKPPQQGTRPAQTPQKPPQQPARPQQQSTRTQQTPPTTGNAPQQPAQSNTQGQPQTKTIIGKDGKKRVLVRRPPMKTPPKK